MLSERLDIKRIYLSDDKTYQIEEKFDGERFQMHMKDGKFEYFSRRGFSYSDKYGKSYDNGLLTPFLRDCFKYGVQSFILDGEMMGWHKEHKRFGCKGMNFDIKKITENSKFRPCFCVFDILYYNGRPLVGPPEKGGIVLSERLKILDEMFTDMIGVILHSKREIVKNDSEVLRALNKAREEEIEGIVLKERNSYYLANRRNAGWYKIKPEYTEGAMEDLDLVVIGADYAENKKQGLARSFLMACADCPTPGEYPTRWVSIGRVATGLSYEERENVCKKLQRHWKLTSDTPAPSTLVFNKEKPDFWVMPEDSIVFTVRASELIRSESAGAGWSLRFPRVLRVREDKLVRDVLTVGEPGGLLENKGPVVKLSTKQINQDVVVAVKAQRKRTAKILEIPDQFRSKVMKVEANSKALLGRKLCVLSDDEACSKADLETLILSHSGVVVQNFSPSTWCCIYGRKNIHVNNAVKSQQADLVHYSWLVSLTPSEELCPRPNPLEYLAMTYRTKLLMSRDYDSYGDSYKDLIDEEVLKKCFEKMDRDNEPVYQLTTEEKLELDKKLFEDLNPYSFLRRCFIHFPDIISLLVLKAKYFGAKICELDAPDITHIVLRNVQHVDIDRYKEKQNVFVVTEEWLLNCISNKKIVPESEYCV